MSGSRLEVTPTYGMGWWVDGKSYDGVPAPFSVSVEAHQAGSWTGIVVSKGHIFEGRTVELSHRHVEPSGHLNVAIGPDGYATGFATMDL